MGARGHEMLHTRILKEAVDTGGDTTPSHSGKTGDIIMEKESPAQIQAQAEAKQQDPPPKEDFFAWMQVVGAFALNLNTW